MLLPCFCCGGSQPPGYPREKETITFECGVTTYQFPCELDLEISNLRYAAEGNPFLPGDPVECWEDEIVRLHYRSTFEISGPESEECGKPPVDPTGIGIVYRGQSRCYEKTGFRSGEITVQFVCRSGVLYGTTDELEGLFPLDSVEPFLWIANDHRNPIFLNENGPPNLCCDPFPLPVILFADLLATDVP